MKDNELFPLDSVPSRVKFAILREFDGRPPAVQEVAQICDRSWLAVPGIGRTALAWIRQATSDQQPLALDRRSGRVSDDELLTRLDRLQEELRSLHRVLVASLRPGSKTMLPARGARKNAPIPHRQQMPGMAL